MNKYKTIQKIIDSGVVAVIRAESKEQGVKIIEAVRKGGVKAIEVTLTVPNAIDLIKELVPICKSEGIVLGAGTVLDSESARACIFAGASYIVSPAFDAETVALCNRYRIPIMPGVMTPSEIVSALEAGVDICKIFPGNAFGPSYISALKGPFPQGNFMPTGGVDLENVGEWIQAGAIAVGVGSVLTKGAITKDYALVEKTAREFVQAVLEARRKLEVKQ